jgi:hypothetical protein
MSKHEKVLKHLQTKPITGKQAWELYGLYRLSSSINRLRNDGHNIHTEMVKKGKETFAKYKLIKP